MISVANAAFDPETGYLRTDKTVTLSPQMRRVLAALAERPGAPVSHARLIDTMWNGADDGPDERALKVVVFRLRQRMRDAGVRASIINHWGGGYSLREFDNASNHPLTVSPERAAILDMILGRAAAHWPELVRQWETTA